MHVVRRRREPSGANSTAWTAALWARTPSRCSRDLRTSHSATPPPSHDADAKSEPCSAIDVTRRAWAAGASARVAPPPRGASRRSRARMPPACVPSHSELRHDEEVARLVYATRASACTSSQCPRSMARHRTVPSCEVVMRSSPPPPPPSLPPPPWRRRRAAAIWRRGRSLRDGSECFVAEAGGDETERC